MKKTYTHPEFDCKFLDKYRWEHPKNYGGFSPDGDFLAYSKSRDESLLNRSNFNTIKKCLLHVSEQQPECTALHDASDRYSIPDQWVYTWTASCSMRGWVEYLMVRQDAPAPILAELEECLGRLERYPVLNEDDYSRRVHEEIVRRWEQDKHYLLRDHGYDEETWDDIEECPDDILEYLYDTTY